MAADSLGNHLNGVRLDTPSSRRGDMAEIVREVRWELDLRGYKNVKIVVSGGINEENVENIARAGADAFGVGTSVSNAPTIDFAADIVEVEGETFVKRGKLGGKKQVWRCSRCFTYKVTPWNSEAQLCPKCGEKMEELLKKVVENGRIVVDLPTAGEARNYVMKQLEVIRELSWR